MGSCNTSSIYYTSYQSVADESHSASHHFIHSSAVQPSARRTALKYRGGLIYTAKLAHRYGRSPSAMCPLCHQPDSQSHLLGGCSHPQMRDLYMSRHHHASRLIAIALTRNSPHAHLVQADVGSCTSLSAALAHLPRIVPARYLRRNPGGQLPIPDMTLRSRTITGQRSLSYVDIKFGPDTRLEDKLQQGDRYRPLVDATHPSIHRSAHIIPLGVGGRVPMHTFASLLHLGVPAAPCVRLCNSLNRVAVRWMHTIVCARRRLEPD